MSRLFDISRCVAGRDLPGVDAFKIDAAVAEIQQVGRFVRPVQLFARHGAKWNWASFLNDEAFPELLTEPFTFLDVFGGTGIVSFVVNTGDTSDLLARSYWNDKDWNAFNVFRCLQKKPDELILTLKELADDLLHMDDRTRFARLKEMVRDESLDWYARAAAFTLQQKLSFGGKGRNPALSKNMQEKDALRSRMERHFQVVPVWAQAFAGVKLMNTDFETAIGRYLEAERSRPETRVVFLDPPYMGAAASAEYDVTMSDDEHRKLAGVIKRRENNYIMTHSDNAEFRSIYGRGDEEWEVKVNYTLNANHSYARPEVLALWKQRGN